MPSKKQRMMNSHVQMQSLLKAAEKGDLDAQHDVGACYATGDWGGPKDDAEAVKWYTTAAESGHALSQYDLGFMLCLGEGAEKDVPKGLWWLEQAVTNGESYAARLLSDVYAKGMFGVTTDPDRATYWNERAGDFKDKI
jgi:TPR repeat protein